MASKLPPIRISNTLSLPLDFVTSTQAILAQKGKGKSYTGSVEAEELLEAKQQIVIIDPTNAWFGLKSSPDGRSTGYSIPVFGGDNADLPLEVEAAEMLATAITTEHFSAIICTENFSKGQELRFMWAFLETLYRKNRTAMHLFVDEADIFAPQKPFGGDEARVLGAMQNVVRRGRKKGIGVTLISQRAQVLNKDVLSQIDQLVAMGMNHPLDLDAVEDWVARHDTKKVGKAMMDTIPSLPLGDAWVWNPMLDLLKRVTIRERHTFDSGATPKPGEKAHVAKVLAPIDLERLGQTIKASAEQAKANDPKLLKAEIERLKKAKDVLESGVERSIRTQLGKAAPKVVEKRVLKDGQIKRVELMITAGEKLIDRWNNVSADAHEALDTLRGKATEAFTCLGIELTGIRAAIARTKELSPAHSPQTGRSTQERAPQAARGGSPTRPRTSVTGAGYERRVTDVAAGETALSKMERLMLVALAQHPDGLTRKQVLIFSGYRHSGSTTSAFARLLADEYAEKSHGMLVATSRGMVTLGDFDPLPLGDDLRATLLNGHSDLSTMEKEILRRTCEVYPESISRESARGDYAHSGSTTSAFARLIAMNYVVKAPGGIRAAEELFS